MSALVDRPSLLSNMENQRHLSSIFHVCPNLKMIRIRLDVKHFSHYLFAYDMHPRNIWCEFSQESSRFAGAPTASKSDILQIGFSIRQAYLTIKIVPQWHSPHPITSMNASEFNLIPELVACCKDCTACFAQRLIRISGAHTNVHDEFRIKIVCIR